MLGYARNHYLIAYDDDMDIYVNINDITRIENRDYEKILDTIFKEWRNKCMSSSWNHIRESPNSGVYSFNCMNIIPNYKSESQEHYYSKSINLKYYLPYILITILLVIVIIFISKNKIITASIND